jgi:hypothetical protein
MLKEGAVGDFEDFVTGCATDCVEAREVGCHVRPEPVEVGVSHRWDLRDHRAAIRAWQRVAVPGQRISFDTTVLIIQTYLDAMGGR